MNLQRQPVGFCARFRRSADGLFVFTGMQCDRCRSSGWKEAILEERWMFRQEMQLFLANERKFVARKVREMMLEEKKKLEDIIKTQGREIEILQKETRWQRTQIKDLEKTINDQRQEMDHIKTTLIRSQQCETDMLRKNVQCQSLQFQKLEETFDEQQNEMKRLEMWLEALEKRLTQDRKVGEDKDDKISQLATQLANLKETVVDDLVRELPRKIKKDSPIFSLLKSVVEDIYRKDINTMSEALEELDEFVRRGFGALWLLFDPGNS